MKNLETTNGQWVVDLLKENPSANVKLGKQDDDMDIVDMWTINKCPRSNEFVFERNARFVFMCKSKQTAIKKINTIDFDVFLVEEEEEI